MVTKLIMACILSATLLSCNGQNTNTINYATVEPLHINRFDKDLFRLIDTEDTTLQPELIKHLIVHGVPSLHFYTMMASDSVYKIAKEIY